MLLNRRSLGSTNSLGLLTRVRIENELFEKVQPDIGILTTCIFQKNERFQVRVIPCESLSIVLIFLTASLVVWRTANPTFLSLYERTVGHRRFVTIFLLFSKIATKVFIFFNFLHSPSSSLLSTFRLLLFSSLIFCSLLLSPELFFAKCFSHLLLQQSSLFLFLICKLIISLFKYILLVILVTKIHCSLLLFPPPIKYTQSC